MPAMKPTSHFKKIQNFKADYAASEFTQYESERTGMRVAVVDQKGPKVMGYFAFATEIGDDSGAPHTLEHLVFMGSRKYKYKGVLDKLATRAYSFTNAWTGTDQTVYTLDTAGWEGFSQILPVYLDHCMLPTLTDEGCYTEVHHIDGTGNDAGVVYSEMQGVQNNQSELMELEAKRLIYPEGNGFRYETGGMMEALRVLTPERIREFHKQMYQPKNLRVILIGEIDHTQLLSIMDEFEESIQDLMPPIDAPFTRPFVDSKKTPPIEKNIIKTVEFPEEDESSGEVLISFLGPDCNNMLLGRALNVLIVYLVGSSIGLLENTLVEKEELCSAVYGYLETRPDYILRFSLTSVATEKLADVEKRFFEVVKEAAAKPLNMEYMHDCLRRYRRQHVYHTETSYSAFSDPMIEDHLFGHRNGEDLSEAIQSLEGFEVLENWTDKQWRDLFAKYITENNHVTILGVPSAKLSKEMKEKETARVKEQQEKLGEEGLKGLAKRLEEAKAANDKPIPDGLLDSFPIPGTDSIHFIPSTTARSGLAKEMGHLDNDIQKIVDKDISDDLPLFIHFEHVQTSFVHFQLILNTSVVPLELKPLLPVYLMNFFDTPVERNGKRIEFEQIVMQLEKDTITYVMENGRNIGNSELIRIKFVVEPEKYETAIKWLRDLLFHGIFDASRLKPLLSKMMADIPDEKRDGNDMVHSVDSMVHFAPVSSSRAQNTLVKALYLKRVAKLLATSPATVISMMEELRKSLLTFSNMRAFVVSDLTKLSNPVSTWKHLVQDLDTKQSLIPLDLRRSVLSQEAKEPGKLAFLVPMSTIDSSFASLTTKGPDSYQHPKLPALMVALAYLDAVEGPFWVAIRGTGLAYGTNFARSVDTGLLSFSIYRSPNAFQAYEAARNVIEEFVAGKRSFERHSLEGAISSIVVGFVDDETTATRAAAVGFVNQVIKGIPKDWGTQILRKVRAVTEDELMDVMKEIVLPVFLPGSTDLMVTCAGIMEDDLKKNFEKAGFKPEVRTLASFQDGYGLPAVEGEEDVDDDEDDDDEDDEESGDEDEEEDHE